MEKELKGLEKLGQGNKFLTTRLKHSLISVNGEDSKSKINELDVSQLPSGTYNFVISYDGKSINKKVIKQWESY